MRAFVLSAAIPMMIGMSTIGCRQENHAGDVNKVTADEVQEKATGAMQAAGQYAGQKRDEFVQATQQKLDALDRDLSDLKAEAKQKGKQLSDSVQKKLSSLDDERAKLDEKLDDVRNAGKDTWQSLKSGMADAIKKVQASLEDARGSLESESAQTNASNKPAKANGASTN